MWVADGVLCSRKLGGDAGEAEWLAQLGRLGSAAVGGWVPPLGDK